MHFKDMVFELPEVITSCLAYAASPAIGLAYNHSVATLSAAFLLMHLELAFVVKGLVT